MTTDFLKRYLSGDFSAWDELTALSPDVLESNTLQSQAKQLAKEIMVRVRRNVGVIRKKLISSGASIGPEGSPATTENISYLTDRFGALPISIDAFYNVVGSISLTPKNDYDYGKVSFEKVSGISLVALDPLQIYSATDLVETLDDYKQDECDEDEPFQLFLCPDFLHKQNTSGGMPYFIELPTETPKDQVDPIVQWDRHTLSFVNYLRYYFEWGGFPGLDILTQNENEIDPNLQTAFKNSRRSSQSDSEFLLNELRANLVSF